MTEDVASEPSSASPSTLRPKVRAVASVGAGILGVVGVVACVVTVWAHQVLFDPGRVAGAVDKALQEPAVTEALAGHLTDQVFAAVPVADLIADTLPDDLERLAPVLAGGVRALVNDGIARLLADDSARQAIATATETSHRAVLALLQGDGLVDGVSVEGGEVSVNLLPLLGRGLGVLQGAGLLTDVDLPELTADGSPASQIAALEDAIGRDLPDDLGQLVVYRGERIGRAEQAVARAQQALAVSKRAAWLLVALTVGSLAASVALAVGRRRTVVVLLLAGSAALAVTRVVINRVVEAAPDLVVEPGGRAAISAIVSSLAGGLLAVDTIALVAGLALAMVFFLTGPSPRAEAVRGRASGSRSVRAVVDANRDAVAISAFGLAVLVLTLAGLGAGALLLAMLLAALGAWALLAPRPEAVEGSAQP